MTVRKMTRLAFMSKTPGPWARPSSSRRNGIRSSVPRGQTVSKWPSTRAGRCSAGPEKRPIRWSPPWTLGMISTAAPTSRKPVRQERRQGVESRLVTAGRLEAHQLGTGG